MYEVRYIDGEPDEITDYSSGGKCADCGSCCGNFIPASAKELRKIHRYVDAHKIEMRRKLYPLITQPDIDGTCPFRDDHANVCTVYEVRPAVCRIFRCDRKPTVPELMQMRGAKVVDLRKEIFGIEDNYSGLGIDETRRMGRIQFERSKQHN